MGDIYIYTYAVHIYIYTYTCMYYSKPSTYMADCYCTSTTIWTAISGTEGVSAQTSIWVGHEGMKRGKPLMTCKKWESKLRKGRTWQQDKVKD